jgi:PAS domain S-box-containing protein
MTLSHPLVRSTSVQVNQLRTLLDWSPLPMVITEGHAHVVRYANPAFCTLIGQAAESIVDRPLRAPLRDTSQLQERDSIASLDRVYSTGSAPDS